MLVVSASAAEPMRASKPEVKKEIVAVIDAQLAAFRKGDLPKAYTYAAGDLRAEKSLPIFTAIVKENYPEIWANLRAEYGIARDSGTRATITVQVYAKDHDAAYDFTLSKESGGWRIYGVDRHEPRRKTTL
jgi:hypothetical protein